MEFSIGPQQVLVVFEDRQAVNGGIVCRQFLARTISASMREFHSGKILKPGEHVDVMVRGNRRPIRLTNLDGKLTTSIPAGR